MSTSLEPEFAAAVEATIAAGYARNHYFGLPTRWTKQQRADYVAERAASIGQQIATLAGPLHEDLVAGWSKRHRGRECDEYSRQQLWDAALRILADAFVAEEFDENYWYDSPWPRSG